MYLFFFFFFLFFFLFSLLLSCFLFFFFFNDTATTEIYTLSLHDALPISRAAPATAWGRDRARCDRGRDRKSTRLNSSHHSISYAVFCLKKKKKKYKNTRKDNIYEKKEERCETCPKK